MASLNSELESAIDDGDVAKVKRLLAKGASLTRRGESSGKTPLSRAATRGQWKVCQVLLEAGADVNAKDSRKGTPLLAAAEFGTPEVAEKLIARGADVDARDEFGRNALALAKSDEMVTRLLDLGVKPYPGLERWLTFHPPDLKRRDYRRDEALEKVAILRTVRDRWPEGRDALTKLLGPVERLERKKAAPKAASKPLGAAWEKKMNTAIGTRIKGRHGKLADLAAEELARPEAVAHRAWPKLVKQLVDLTQHYEDLTEDAYGERLPVSRMEEDEGGVAESYCEDSLHTLDIALGLLGQPPAVAHPQWPALVEYVLSKKVQAVGPVMSVGDDELTALFDEPAVKKHPKRSALRRLAKKAYKNLEL